MPEADRPRAKTVPNQFQHLTILQAALKLSSRRSYHSFELPATPRRPSTFRFHTTVSSLHHNPSHLLEPPSPANMFASTMNRVDAAETRSREASTTGDFDQTPAPSARPSMAQIRSDDEAVASDHSSHSKELVRMQHSTRISAAGVALADTVSNGSSLHSRRPSAVLPDGASDRSNGWSDHAGRSPSGIARWHRRRAADPGSARAWLVA